MKNRAMKLTSSRKVKLVLFKILEFAEIGGMAPEDCGLLWESVSNCLDEVGVCEDDQSSMENLVKQLQQIIEADEWDQKLPGHD